MAGTVAVTISKVERYHGFKSNNAVKIKVVTFTCVGDHSNGTVPNTSTDSGDATANNSTITDEIKGMFLRKVQSIPGTTPPTANAGVALRDSNSIDLLGGMGADLIQASTPTEVAANIAGVAADQPVDSALTLVISDNTAIDANIVIKAFFVE